MAPSPVPGRLIHSPQPVPPVGFSTAGNYPVSSLRLWSALTGGLWGALCAALVGVLIYALHTPQLAFDAFPTLCWGGVWGGVWGTMWGVCRLPAASLTPRLRSRSRRIMTGAILGALLGALTSAIVGVVPGRIGEANQGAFLEALSRLPQQDLLHTIQGLLPEVITRLQVHATPGLLSGMLLGLIWGARGR